MIVIIFDDGYDGYDGFMDLCDGLMWKRAACEKKNTNKKDLSNYNLKFSQLQNLQIWAERKKLFHKL